jgi:hypothetical protein
MGNHPKLKECDVRDKAGMRRAGTRFFGGF